MVLIIILFQIFNAGTARLTARSLNQNSFFLDSSIFSNFDDEALAVPE